ncbi:MAG: hypothetical protein ACI9T8_000621 [Candidatus Saccharimonadales bacterium]|jgi:uncharacterized protein YabE (DUF348 family)
MTKKQNKLLKKTKKNAHKRAKFLLRHPLLMPVTIFFMVIFFGLGLLVTVGASTKGATDTKIVDLYVDGEQQTLSTRAKTVIDLIDRLDIELIEEDIVEPARESAILEDNTQINIYRARPVSVTDGDRTITVLSAQQAPRLVASEAGLKLLPEDEVFFENSNEGILTSLASEQLLVDRSAEVQLNVYGVIRKFRTTLDTVGEVLASNNIVLNENESVQPANPDSLITPGILISINRPGIQTLALTEAIEFSTESRSESSLTVGQTKLERAGVNGERAVIYEIKSDEEGNEISREEIQIITTIDPISEITLRGSKPATLSSTLNVSADKIALMAAAGISPADYAYVDFIVSRESTWRPGAVNSSSGAYGLCQSLPASKMATAGSDYLTNPVTQLRWCSSYSARYGGWAGSYNAWLAQHWW